MFQDGIRNLVFSKTTEVMTEKEVDMLRTASSKCLVNSITAFGFEHVDGISTSCLRLEIRDAEILRVCIRRPSGNV